MSLDLIFVMAAIGTGIIAGVYLDVFGFLLVVVVPTMILLLLGVAWMQEASVWIVPLSWVAQQAAYLAMLWLTRPKAYRVVVDRVRFLVRW